MISTSLRISIWKTLRVNFSYFTPAKALRFPILVARSVVLKSVKGKVILDGEPTFARIRIGFGDMGHIDGKRERSIWQNNGTIHFRGRAYLGMATRVSCQQNACIEFGNQFNITGRTTLLAAKKIVFGDNCLISWDVLIMDTDFHPIYNRVGDRINPDKAIVVGDKVWIGCNVTLLKGANIASGSIIGANSKVSGVLKTGNAIYAGEPLTLKREQISWEY